MLMLTACDEPHNTDQTADHVATSALQQQAPTTAMPVPAQTWEVSIPTTEAEHAELLQKLLQHPRQDAFYATQVKQLADSYLDQYDSQTETGHRVMLGFIHTLCEQPDRFSGRDFERALRYCEYLEGSTYAARLPILKAEIQLADYRLNPSQKSQILAELEKIAKQVEPEISAHALAALVQHCPQQQQAAYLQQYFAQQPAVGTPHRLVMLRQGAAFAPTPASIVAEEASNGANADEVYETVRYLMQNYPQQLDALTAHEVLRPYVLTKKLHDLLENNGSAIDTQTTAAALADCLTSAPAAMSNIMLARYYQQRGEQELGIRHARRAAEINGSYREEAQLLLAALLHSVPEYADETEHLYNQLAHSPNPAIVARALRADMERLEECGKIPAAYQRGCELLSVHLTAQQRALLLLKMAELAESMGNISQAINFYSQVETEYGAEPAYALPACANLIRLLRLRHHPQRTDKTKGTYTPSDAWYARERGAAYLRGLKNTPQWQNSLTPQLHEHLQLIEQHLNELNIDYDVLMEERERTR